MNTRATKLRPCIACQALTLHRDRQGRPRCADVECRLTTARKETR